MDKVKLKPCPFCGCKNIVIEKPYQRSRVIPWTVKCALCYANVFDRTKKAAVATWNKRHEPPTPGGAIVPAGNERLRG